MESKITEIQITPIRPNNGLVAFVDFVYDNRFHLSSIGIYTRPQGGYRLTYPTKKTGTKDISLFYPINRETSEAIERVVIAKFEEVTKTYDRYNCIDLK